MNAAPAVECVLRAASTLDMRPAKPRFTDDDRPRSDANVTKRPNYVFNRYPYSSCLNKKSIC